MFAIMNSLQSKIHLCTIVNVSLINAAVNTLLAFFKILLGILGHSQALVSDGLHSFSDLLTDGLIIVTGYVGAQSPDKEHPYGHRRIETIGSIIIAVILIFVSIIFTFDTLHHLIHHTHLPLPAFPVMIVSVISIVANEILFRYTLSKGNQINSDLLRGNAWHNRSDSLVSLIVFISVIGSRVGITYLDAIGAFLIAVLILRMGFTMIWNNGKELIDTAVDNNTLKKITETIVCVPGVLSIHQLRTRYHGGNIFVDVHIQVAHDISVSEGHYIGEQVHLLLLKQVEHVADVTIHIDPENDSTSMPSATLPDRQTILQLLNDRCENLPAFSEIRHTILHYLNGKLCIEIYFPLSVVLKIEKKSLEQKYQNVLQDLNIIKQVTIYFE